MIEIPFVEPQWIELVPEAGSTKAGRAPAAAAARPGRVRLGTPIGQPLTEELAAGDLPLKSLLKQSPGSAFHFVQLACSFVPDEATFKSVNLRAQLRHAGDAPERPIALALVPSTTGEESGGEVGAGIEASLGVVKFKVDGKQSEKWKKLTIIPFGLQTSLAGWELRETKLSPIEGIFAFALVVKSVKGVPVQLRASVSAVATETKFIFVQRDTTVSVDPLTITMTS